MLGDRRGSSDSEVRDIPCGFGLLAGIWVSNLPNEHEYGKVGAKRDGDTCCKFEIRIYLIHVSSLTCAKVASCSKADKDANVQLLTTLFGATGRTRKTTRREKQFELEDLPVTVTLYNMWQHSPGVTGSQPHERLRTPHERTVAAPVHV